MASILIPAGGALDVVVPASSAIAVDSLSGFQVFQLVAGSPNQPAQLSPLIDVPASSTAPYVSSVFTSATTVRVQATGNVDVYVEVGTAPIVKQFKGFIKQATPVTQSTAATLTAAQLTAGIIQTNPAGAINLTLPTVAATEAATSFQIGEGWDFDVINLNATNAATILTGGAGWTLTGNMAVALSTSARFRIHKTAAATFTLYRLG